MPVTLTEAATLFAQTQPPIALDTFAERIGKCPETILRWKAAGMIEVTNIQGKNYILPHHIMIFNARAEAGEFGKEMKHVKELKSRRNQPRKPR